MLSSCSRKLAAAASHFPVAELRFRGAGEERKRGCSRQRCLSPPCMGEASPWWASFAPWSSTFLFFIVWCETPWNENIKEPFIKILSVVRSVNSAPGHSFLLIIEMAETSDCHCNSPAPLKWKNNKVSLKKTAWAGPLGGAGCISRFQALGLVPFSLD